MAPLRKPLTGVVCALAVSFGAVAGAQTQPSSLVAVVQTPENDPIAHAMVRIESAGLGPYETTDSGRFVFPLTANVRVGHEATFRVEPSKNKKWVIVYPCDLKNGRTYSLPDVGGEPIRIVAVLWGSSQLKKFYSPVCLVAERASQFRPDTSAEGPRVSRFLNKEPPILAAQMETQYLREREQQPSGTQHFEIIHAAYRAQTSINGARSVSKSHTDVVDPRLDEFLAAKAIELGLTVGDLADMIKTWSISVEDPYEKGLAALYDQRYPEASRYISASIPSPPGAFLERYVPLAFAEYQQAHYASAEAYLRKVLAVHSDDPILIEALGTVLGAQAKYNEAEPLLRRALAIDEKALGAEHPIVAADVGSLAELYLDRDGYAEAEPLLKRALGIDERALGPDHPRVAEDLTNLASVYGREGRSAEAEPLFKRALAIDESVFGSEHPSLASLLANLGRLYIDQDRNAEAELLLKRAVAIDERALGPDHPSLASDLKFLAQVYSNLREYAEAERLYKRALGIFEKTIGPDHPDVGAVLNDLGFDYLVQGRYAEAEPLLKRALGIFERTLGPNHPRLSMVLVNLGQLYGEQRRYSEAEPLYRRALAIDEKAFGVEHPQVVSDLNHLGDLYFHDGKYSEAELYEKRALDVDQKASGANSPNVAMDLNNLGEDYFHLGKYAEGEVLYKQALAIVEKVLGSDHPSVATVLDSVAELHCAQGNDDAVPLFRRALAIDERALGPDHLDVADIDSDLAQCLHKLGRNAEARGYEDQAARIRLKISQERKDNNPER